MKYRSSHRYKAVRSGIKTVRVCLLRSIPHSPAALRIYGIVYRQLRRHIERFEPWRSKGLHS